MLGEFLWWCGFYVDLYIVGCVIWVDGVWVMVVGVVFGCMMCLLVIDN